MTIAESEISTGSSRLQTGVSRPPFLMPHKRLATAPPPPLQEQSVQDRPFHLKPHVARTLPGLRGVWAQNHPGHFHQRFPVTGLNTLLRTEQLLSVDETRHESYLDRFEKDAWRLQYQDTRWIDNDVMESADKDRPLLLLALADKHWAPTLDLLIDGLLTHREDLRMFVLPDAQDAQLTAAETTERLRSAPGDLLHRAEVLPPPTSPVTMPAPYYVAGFGAAADHGLLKSQRERTSLLICSKKGPKFGSDPACIAAVVDGSESSARALADAAFLSRKGDTIEVIIVVPELGTPCSRMLQTQYSNLVAGSGENMIPEAKWLQSRFEGRTVNVRSVVLVQNSVVVTATQQATECASALLCVGVNEQEMKVELIMRSPCSVCLAAPGSKSK